MPPRMPASGCANRVPSAIPAAPAASTSITPAASTAGLGVPITPRAWVKATEAPASRTVAGSTPARAATWARVRVAAETGKLS